MPIEPPWYVFSNYVNFHLRISIFEGYAFISNFVYSHHITRKRLLAVDIKFDFFLEASSLKVDSLIEMQKLSGFLVILHKQPLS